MVRIRPRSGDRGLTMVGHDADGTSRVIRMSLYADRSIWDLTPAGELHPALPGDYVGRPLGADAFLLCLHCHMTSIGHLSDRSSPMAADHGIGCERCHGAAGNHVRAVALNLTDPAIARPRLASPPRSTGSVEAAIIPTTRESPRISLGLCGFTPAR